MGIGGTMDLIITGIVAGELGTLAMDSLNLKTFATLSPADENGIVSTEGFIKTIENKGGEVVYMGWYSGNPDDLKIQYKEMRDIAFSILESDTLDTNNVLLDSTLVLKTNGDSLKIKLSTIDALYMPIYQNHIKFALPQLAWWNFDLQILGDGSFYNLELMNMDRSYANGAIFSNNYFIDEEDSEYMELLGEFRRLTGEDFSMLNVYGYEMIAYLLNVAGDQSFTRENISDKLQDVQAYRGLIRNMYFDSRDVRSNKGIRIISFKNRQFHKLN